MIRSDQIGRAFIDTKVPCRIISLVPSQTELLVALGLSDFIVGITRFCVHPAKIRKEKVIVGGTKKVDYTKIDQVMPSIILCNKEENTKEIVETLEKKYPVHVSDIESIEDAIEMIGQYGEIFERRVKAAQLVTTIYTELNSFKNFVKNSSDKKVAYFIWRKPWMVAGANTFITHMLQINGFVNYFESQNRYPEVSEDKLTNLKELDLILLSSEPFPFAQKHIDELKVILPDTKVILVNGEYFSWYGSRLVDAFAYFRTLHKDIVD
ncbi:ABC transporter substrate-binding protein [Aquimarina sp. RZ0]|uniref:ABC transporter substrate-binding protein n=1 Tax=Aquimarina sp. RZ0 TaxID=2607730 RepID=UPI0011F2EF5D|nr:helical backbone metal receptor [Aquimarina sp. RZ0]KAA1246052.1 ABC transporter substrate-binding protein [Aquimarina sp. RZ0]